MWAQVWSGGTAVAVGQDEEGSEAIWAAMRERVDLSVERESAVSFLLRAL